MDDLCASYTNKTNITDDFIRKFPACYKRPIPLQLTFIIVILLEVPERKLGACVGIAGDLLLLIPPLGQLFVVRVERAADHVVNQPESVRYDVNRVAFLAVDQLDSPDVITVARAVLAVTGHLADRGATRGSSTMGGASVSHGFWSSME